ncbi:uncharacterized protein LOC133485982 [Phyllopteryx taeniolatus]|uniref:uncharacterized protein LOC133485982 n=1 Tax=Phyllopteryx taeniolatus TaxID=161469 RepID=UPI002AD431EF|nr:uncharacterized protein LOC133485982 [Phyllopteryx taeniolatus]
MGRSASSVSTCLRALTKKPLQHLSSLPLQPRARLANPSTSWEEHEEEEDHFLFGSGNDSTPTSGSLLAHCEINLIPPTPSDVIEDDQFFDENSEESDSSFADYEENVETKEATLGLRLTESEMILDKALDSEADKCDQLAEEREMIKDKDGDEQKSKAMLSRFYQVDPLPVLPQKCNTGIKPLPFTELNLGDLSNSDVSCFDMLKTLVGLPALKAPTMDAFTRQRKPITRSFSLGDTQTGSATFHALTQTSDQQQQHGKRSPRQRRTTVASCVSKCKDQNGNFPEKTVNRPEAKSLRQRNTNETCQWFTSIGLQKCLPFIQEANLCGADIVSIDVRILDTLHINTLKDKEQLLSAIYNELHPPSTFGSFGYNHVETFMPMIKSKSSPQVNCLSINRPSLKIRHNKQNYTAQRNSQLIEVTINASEQIVHLRTPTETTVAKIMDSCLRMMGMTEDKSFFSLKEQRDSMAELSQDQQIGSLLTSLSDKQLELHLCKRETGVPGENPRRHGENMQTPHRRGRGLNPAPQNCEADPLTSRPEANSSTGIQKEERIRELKLQVESLQNVILQVQELHLGLVTFCSELKNTDGDGNLEMLSSAELEHKLELLQRRLSDKRKSLQSLRDNISNSAAHRKKQLDVHLLEKIKLNCQVFKEEISMVHLNRQVARLQNVLQDTYIKEKAPRKNMTVGSLSQLVSPQTPAMLLAFQERSGPDGRYGFTCRYAEGSGLVVVKVDNSQLCVDDRLVEVNGSSVVNWTEEELSDLLLQITSAQIIVLRQPPATLTSHQAPLILQHMVTPNPLQAERDVIVMETPSLRRLMAI